MKYQKSVKNLLGEGLEPVTGGFEEKFSHVKV